jgi:cation transport ATPase
LDTVIAEVLPEDKADEVKRLQSERRKVAIVGIVGDGAGMMWRSKRPTSC